MISLKIVGLDRCVDALLWCEENLGSKNERWRYRIFSVSELSKLHKFTYEFSFQTEADAIWFSLVHGDSIL